MAGVGSVIGSQLKTHAYPILGGIVSGGAVYAVASRVFSGRALPLAMGVVAGSLVGYVIAAYSSTKSCSPENGKKKLPEQEKVPSLQNIKVSPEIKPNNAKQVQKVIDLLARHEALLQQLKIPGLIERLEQVLKSGNLEDILACEDFLKEKVISAIKIGDDPWMLPQGNGKDNDVEIAMVDDGKSYVFKTTQSGCSTILNKLGLVSNAALSHDSVYRLAIEIENSQISKVTRFNDKRERIGDPIVIYKDNRYAFLYKSGMRKMPDLPEGYPENQKKFANILINTIWLNPDNYSLRWKIEDVLSNNTFSDLLDILADLAFKGRGKQMKFGDEVFKDRINVFDEEGLLELCSFAENADQPTAAVFDLDKIRAHAMEIGVPLIWRKEQIMMNLDSLERLLATGAERVAIMRILDNSQDIVHLNVPKELQSAVALKNYRDCYLHKEVLFVCPTRDKKPRGYACTFSIEDVLNQWPLPGNIQKVILHKDKIQLVFKDPANKAVSLTSPPLKNNAMVKCLPEEKFEWKDVE
jgi:hypothetical protein